MRIVLTVNYSPWSAYVGGGQRSTHFLAEALAKRGHRVTTIFTKTPWEKVNVPKRLSYDVRWAHFVGLRSDRAARLRTANAWTVAKTLQSLLSHDAIDIVHCQGEEGALLPFLRRKHPGFGLVATPRYPSYPDRLKLPPRTLKDVIWGWTVPPKFLALGALLHHADRCCPTSVASAKAIERAYSIPSSSCTVVPNGVAPVYFDVQRDSVASTQGPIVFFGRLEHSKGLDVLIDALESLGAAAPETWIIGRGALEASVRKQVQRIGLDNKVRFLGWLEPTELADVLKSARFAVLPSREESFGNAMIEAMASGVPLITTRAGSIAEVVADAAYLVEPAQPAALTVAMRDLLDNPQRAQELGQKGLVHAKSRYSWDATAAAFEKIYTEVKRTFRRATT